MPLVVNKPEKVKKTKQYVPSHRSGGYAILLTLYQNRNKYSMMTKTDIIAYGQQYCDKSFLIPAQHNYTAWSAIQTLVKKELVEVFGGRKYSLTDQGLSLAEILEKALIMDPNTNNNKSKPYGGSTKLDDVSNGHDVNVSAVQPCIVNMEDSFVQLQDIPNQSSPPPSFTKNGRLIKSTNTFAKEKYEYERNLQKKAMQSFSNNFIKLSKDNYELILVIDNREVAKQNERDYFQVQLMGKGISVVTTKLAIGDFCWAARPKNSFQSLYLIDYIVERKCNNDLASSIIDNRYKEQKAISI
jgi:crossover junction endonuclease MUS81